MASVCGSTLSLMDAGVPIKAPVAGIAMGLIKEGDDYVVLSDIAGVEDHLGDMDFKVAGTEKGITALQMDIKITGVTFDILRDALDAGQGGPRVHPRQDGRGDRRAARASSPSSRRASRSIKIDPDKIGLLIGKGGETIRSLQEEYEAQIDVDDEGNVRVYAQTGAQGDALVERIRSMTKEVEVGDEFPGAKVVKTTHVRRVRRARQGHRRPAAHLQRLARPARRDGRGGPQQGRRDLGPRGRGRPRARPHRPAPGRGPGDRRQDQGGARDRRHRRRRRAAAATAAATAAAAAAAATARRNGRGGGDRGGRDRDRGRARRAAIAIPTAG